MSNEMINKYKLGIVGAGNMSTAIWKGVLKSGIVAESDLIVSDVSDEKLSLVRACGVATTFDNVYIAQNCDYILFAVKPQSFDDIAAVLCGKVSANVISIMAGVKIVTLKQKLAAERVCRVMPNTPCMVQSGISALCFDGYAEGDKPFVLKIFESIGEALQLPENLFDAVTSVSGSGPAYVYMFIDAMIKGGIKGGLTYEQAKQLTLATLRGGAAMVETSDKSIDSLVDAVCSKGGTTIQAVEHYRKCNLTDIIVQGIDKCRMRSVEMGNPGAPKTVHIYTDGACSGNPGPGGWCAIVITAEGEKVISGGEKETTNNRMELTAVIKGLQSLDSKSNVEISSDSAYVVNAFLSDWISSWKAKGWADVKNPDLWQQLVSLAEFHNVKFTKVKGHADDEYNNKCDAVAREEVKKFINE